MGGTSPRYLAEIRQKNAELREKLDLVAAAWELHQCQGALMVPGLALQPGPKAR